jgi:hypothetical protein
MRTPINWLKDFTDIDEEIKDFCDLMTMTGTKVEGFSQLRRHFRVKWTVKY